MKVHYLGPVGTFTFAAAKSFFQESEDCVFEACASELEVIRKASERTGDFGVVPIENSVHGEVIPTLDALLFDFSGFYIVGEISLPVTFGFFVTDVSAVPKVVISHPHALAQCKRFIAEAGLIERTAPSTADACRIVAENQDPNVGAIASHDAGKLFGLTLRRNEVEDFAGAYTRFLVLSNNLGSTQDRSCTYRSMLAVSPPSSGTGKLAEVTGAFLKNGNNILSVHTRPVKRASGQDVFTLTVDGTIQDGPGKRAVDILRSVGYKLKILGVYPRCDGHKKIGQENGLHSERQNFRAAT